jgi:hypothetical protein
MIARFFRTSSPAKPAALYVALFLTLPDESGANGVEVGGGGYARVRNGPADANWSAPSGGDGQLRNLVTVAFNPPTTDWGTIVGFGLYDALTGGNAWILAPLETPLTVRAGDPPPIFAPGDLVITLA